VEKEMKFSIDLLQSNDDIVKKILNKLKDQLNKTINKSLPSIEQDIKILVKEALTSEPEYSSLKAGTLRAELGIANVSDVDNVIDAMVNTLKIDNKTLSVRSSGISGGFILTMIKSDDISGIIYSDSANVIDNERGYSLPWLEWLLLKGNEVLVQNYSVNYTSSSRSRSGMALMIQSNTDWRVPVAFAGKIDDNWTTRAISKIESQIIKIIQTNIENNI
jgi:hypothetical protein